MLLAWLRHPWAALVTKPMGLVLPSKTRFFNFCCNIFGEHQTSWVRQGVVAIPWVASKWLKK